MRLTKSNSTPTPSLSPPLPSPPLIQRASWRPVLIIAAVVFFILLLLGLRSGGGGGVMRTAPAETFGIMLDAGSTGSRVHVYRFDEAGSGTLVLRSELFEQLKPGLSSYKDLPRAGAESLVPLLKQALDVVPASRRSVTPINLKATAGLRLLEAAQVCAAFCFFQRFLVF